MGYKWLKGSEGKWFMQDPPWIVYANGKLFGRRTFGGQIEAIRLALGDKETDAIIAECDKAASRGEYIEKWTM